MDKRPTIVFDTVKCSEPGKCLLCVRACPRKCVGYMQAETPSPGKAPEKWKLVAAFMVTCDLCNLCAESCPEEAIQVVAPA